MVTSDDWGRGKNCTMLVFDNKANGCLSSVVLNPIQSGEVNVVIRFGANPGVNLTLTDPPRVNHERFNLSYFIFLMLLK